MEFGGKLGFLTGGSTITAPEPRTGHTCLEELTKLLNKTQGEFPRALTTSLGRPGQSQSVHPFCPTILGSVSGNFKSTTGRMNKYLVTSLIM